MSSSSDLEAIYDAAFAAMEAGEYQTAKIGFMKLIARRATIPDAERSFSSGGRESIKWRDADLASLIAECDRMQAAATHAAAGGFVQIPVTYQRPGVTGDYL